MPCSLRKRSRCSRGIRRSCEPGMRYPRKRPESNHLLTVRGATLHIFATWPVVNTFFISRTPLALFGARPRRFPHPSGLTHCRRGDSPSSTANFDRSGPPDRPDSPRETAIVERRSDPAPAPGILTTRPCLLRSYVIDGRSDHVGHTFCQPLPATRPGPPPR